MHTIDFEVKFYCLLLSHIIHLLVDFAPRILLSLRLDLDCSMRRQRLRLVNHHVVAVITRTDTLLPFLLYSLLIHHHTIVDHYQAIKEAFKPHQHPLQSLLVEVLITITALALITTIVIIITFVIVIAIAIILLILLDQAIYHLRFAFEMMIIMELTNFKRCSDFSRPQDHLGRLELHFLVVNQVQQHLYLVNSLEKLKQRNIQMFVKNSDINF